MSVRHGTALGLLLAALASGMPAHGADAAREAGPRARAAGFAALNAGDLRAAEARFAQALARDPADRDAQGGMGVVRLRQRRFADAAALLAQAAQGAKVRQWAEALATARYYAGIDAMRMLLAAGDLAQARRTGEVLIAAGYVHDGEARELLAGIAAGQARHGDASALYRQAAQAAAPVDAPRLIAAAAREAARGAIVAGNSAGAEAALRDGLVAAPDDVWLRHDYAQLLVDRGQGRRAVEIIQPLTRSSDPQALYAAALVHQALDQPTEAGTLLARIAPTDLTAPMRALADDTAFATEVARAHAIVATQGRGAAAEAYRRIAARPGLTIARQATIAEAVLALGDSDAAADLAGKALAGNAASPRQRAALADVLVRSARSARQHGQDAAALRWLRSARASLADVAADGAALDTEIEDLWRKTAARAELETALRHRSGDAGLGRLDEKTVTARASTIAGGGRVELRGRVIALNAGTPHGAGLAVFGTNPTLTALGAPHGVPRQHAHGFDATIGYGTDAVSAELGLTTVGSGSPRAIGRIAATLHPAAALTIDSWAERKPLTDSLVAYAGTHDPATGARWGRIMRTGAGLALGSDHDGSGLYVQARYARYDGTHVRTNVGVQVDTGGYVRVIGHGPSVLTAGVNLDLQHFRHNENGYSFGTGGYFSPQRFAALSLPLRYRLTRHDTELSVSATPGIQRYRQAAAWLDPLAASGRGQAARPEDRARGFAFAAQLSASHYVARGLRIGSEAAYDSFGSYREWRLAASIRASFGARP